jgi:hypothetical protein
MMEPKLEASVGMSRKWDAREAGRQVADTAIKQLHEPPSFFLLFSTDHYKNLGGFQELLKGVWDVLPEKTPLVGGTVNGFINNHGCYSRGVSGLAVSYTNMDVAIGYGNSTKRFPKKAAKNCINMINSKLKKSTYKNKFLFDMISGTTIPQSSNKERKSLMRSGIISRHPEMGVKMMQTFIQKGFAKEQIILDTLLEGLDDFTVLHGSAGDNNLLENYQFFNDEVFTNSIVALGFCSDIKINGNFGDQANFKTEFDITKISKNRQIIYEVNGKGAYPELLRLLDIKEEIVTERLFTFGIMAYFPLGFYDDNNKKILRPMTSVMGDAVMLMASFDSNKGHLVYNSGKDILSTSKECLQTTSNVKPEFALISSCATRIMTLGKNIHAEREQLLQRYGKKPFIQFYVLGEGIKKPTEKMNYINESLAFTEFGW